MAVSMSKRMAAHKLLSAHRHFRVFQAADYLGPKGHIAAVTHLDAPSKAALLDLLTAAIEHVTDLPEVDPAPAAGEA